MRFILTQYVVVQPTSDGLFLQGDRVLVNRLAQVGSLSDEKEFVAVNLRDSLGENHLMIDLCIAGPGDTIWVTEQFQVSRYTAADTARGVAVCLPQKGREVQVTPANAQLLFVALRNFENRAVTFSNGCLKENDRVLETVVLQHDYYWLRDISLSQGFVPEREVLGRVWCVSYSVGQGYGLWPSFRSNRWFLKLGAS